MVQVVQQPTGEGLSFSLLAGTWQGRGTLTLHECERAVASLPSSASQGYNT